MNSKEVFLISNIAKTPQPPYYAVIFTSQMDGDHHNTQSDYDKMAEAMGSLASKQDGFIGLESSRDASGVGITISYWQSLEAIRGWRENTSHQMAQKMGKEKWYTSYATRICLVERQYFSNGEKQSDTQAASLT